MKEIDLTLPAGEGLLNVRVGAIILRDGKVLMAANEGMSCLYSVGGRVHFGETMEEAVVREVREETGVALEVDRLGFVHEVFFIGEGPYQGSRIHEISLFYYMKVPADFEPRCRSRAANGTREWLEWIDPAAETRTIYPECFREELRRPCRTVKCIPQREWPE